VGNGVLLEPGDHLVFEWGDEYAGLDGGFVHTPTTLTIHQGSPDARMWDSRGNEMALIGWRFVAKAQSGTGGVCGTSCPGAGGARRSDRSPTSLWTN
jgi:hypothetical protein